MEPMLSLDHKIRPPLDPDYVPAALWNAAYRRRCVADSHPLAIATERGDGTVSRFDTSVLPHTGTNIPLNRKYVERLVKFLLWSRGGVRVHIGGDPAIAKMIAGIFGPTGERRFDDEFMGTKVYRDLFRVVACDLADVPGAKESAVPLGRHLDGCRIGFDISGSERKCAAVVDGECVYSEELPWDPYFQSDPRYHYNGINEMLKRAAAHLPRVDAIGGSVAGIYVNNEVRIASLFRGVPFVEFSLRIRNIFHDLQEEWDGVPFEVVNDGEVTALAGAMSLGDNAVLGVSMGTSVAAGYVTPSGSITTWLNELAFAPVDYRDDAPADEWSGDRGCAVQYFSQQGVARLAPLAGIELPAEMNFPEQLAEVQKLMAAGDPRAQQVYETIGIYFGYAVAHYADFYDFRHLLLLGSVMTGEGGNLLLAKANEVLRMEFQNLASRIRLHMPDEKQKRHGRAVVAASLPALQRPRASASRPLMSVIGQ